MANYSVSNLDATSPAQANMTTTYNTLVEIHAASGTALRRIGLYEFEFGIDAAPNATDCSINWNITRTTAAGTAGSAAVPNPLDPADAAALTVAGVNHPNGTPPTYTANSNLFDLGANQRASYRWIARDDKSALWVAATNLAGLGLRAKSATYASTAAATLFFQE